MHGRQRPRPTDRLLVVGRDQCVSSVFVTGADHDGAGGLGPRPFEEPIRTELRPKVSALKLKDLYGPLFKRYGGLHTLDEGRPLDQLVLMVLAEGASQQKAEQVFWIDRRLKGRNF